MKDHCPLSSLSLSLGLAKLQTKRPRPPRTVSENRRSGRYDYLFATQDICGQPSGRGGRNYRVCCNHCVPKIEPSQLRLITRP
ncbi:hypothetical protein I79_019699 [Cricetulus griseus]|uniref:Uncharacterized protein n=1 Tax=Cricetulus griseus TaxID=10029 RepID=G3I842_CRIGR|nr:hypothetical protein I79_019699 [Cricetulus griseus]